MKTKLELAHEYAQLHLINPLYKDVDDLELVKWAFDYAEAMLSENSRRDQAYLLTKDENGNCLHIHTTLNRGECFDCGERLDEFEIDWRIAPIDAKY